MYVAAALEFSIIIKVKYTIEMNTPLANALHLRHRHR